MKLGIYLSFLGAVAIVAMCITTRDLFWYWVAAGAFTPLSVIAVGAVIGFFVENSTAAMPDAITPPGTQPFSKMVRNLSPSFPTIYNQALRAENAGFGHICGPGYRKALEFLIKDFLIKDHEKDRLVIQKTPLGRLISDKVQDENIKQLAHRAVWLGNDETHYLREWTKHDLKDLKKLINLVVESIEHHEATKQAILEMPERGRAQVGPPSPPAEPSQ